MSRGSMIAAILIGLPALAFALWPLLSRRGAEGILPVAPDRREPLLERKRAVLRALRELDFEHEAGHMADDDHAELRARLEAEAAEILTALDQLEPASGPRPAAREAARAIGRGWRHPAAVGAGALALLAFGIALGAGVVRYTTPEPGGGMPAPGSRPLAPPLDAVAGSPAPGGGGGQALSPQMLQGMLQAARASLFEGRYSEAISAYQAVLKRDPKNVDAMTHLGLIVALGGHVDQALETIDRALAIDPGYPPALLYRGQILLESRRDPQGAIASWEKFVAVVPPGEDRDRVAKMIEEAKSRPPR
jgi:cytochrome c-type biogenesis protein CcmH/NrfG